MAYYTTLFLVLLAVVVTTVHCGVLPVVTYGSSYAAHSIDHSIATPFAAPLVTAAHAAPLVAAPAAAAPLLGGYPGGYYAF